MAYVKVSAERDTTLEIWRMMTSDGVRPSHEPVPEMAASVGNAIRSAVRESLASAGDVQHGPVFGRSYADAVSGHVSAAPARGGPAPRGAMGARQGLATLEVVPEKEANSKFADAGIRRFVLWPHHLSSPKSSLL